MPVAMTWSIWALTAGCMAEGRGGARVRCPVIWRSTLSPGKGCDPVRHSYSTQVRAYTSARASQVSVDSRSGAIYARVPMVDPVLVSLVAPAVRAIPKSIRYAKSSSVTRMLDGLTSRCTSPTRCAACSAAAICSVMATARGTVIGPVSSNSWTVLPSISRMVT